MLDERGRQQQEQSTGRESDGVVAALCRCGLFVFNVVEVLGN
jgi:hypothetical protein